MPILRCLHIEGIHLPERILHSDSSWQVMGAVGHFKIEHLRRTRGNAWSGIAGQLCAEEGIGASVSK